MEYVIVNGEIVKKEEAELTSFFWKDPLLLTDKVWFGFGGIPLFTEKIEQLQQQLQVLGANTPELFLNQREFFRRIKRMLNKNRFYRTGLVHFQLLISNTETDFILYATPLEQSELAYHEKGILIRFANQQKYSKTPLVYADNLNRIFNRFATAGNEEAIVQNFVFLNENGMISNAGLANIFMIRNNVLTTPSLAAGCTPDNLRKPVLEAAGNLGFKLEEPEEILPETIFKMDEIFFAGEVTGIQWVLGIETKRFVHRVSAEIHEEINKILKSKVH